jgi:hypothetical protein
MFGIILKAIQNAIAWLFDLLLDGVVAAVQAIGGLVPGLEPIDLSPIAAALSTANQFVPLDLLFVYLSAYLGFVLFFAVTKISIKLIPFGVG